MNKAFELILERLDDYIETAKSEGDFSYIEPFEIAKRAVHKVAEEYNDDWIPCNERLPEENQKVILQDIYGNITIETMKINNGTNGFSDGNWWSSANNYIAWQPSPEPYKESD